MKINKEQLKEILKPLVKQCIKEIIFEEGTLTNIVAEVVQGMGARPLVETRSFQQPQQQPEDPVRNFFQARMQKQSSNSDEARRRILESIAATGYDAVKMFEGTDPSRISGTPKPAVSTHAIPQEAQVPSPLAAVAPSDPGIDLSRIFGANPAWKIT